MVTRTLIGFLLAIVVAAAAKRAHSLSASGAVAAILVGGCAVAAAWSWGAVLLLYFASSAILSRVGRLEKERRTQSVVAKGGARDAMQVFANGGFFAAGALATAVGPAVGTGQDASRLWSAIALGSLAASAADTWATEIGTLYGGLPRSIASGRRVPPGTSGGVTLAGFLATVAGAAFIATLTRLWLADGRSALAIIVGGIAGSVFDSLLGGTVQLVRVCEACGRKTERVIHDCGGATRVERGIPWLDNDIVNLISSGCGGLLAALLVR